MTNVLELFVPNDHTKRKFMKNDSKRGKTKDKAAAIDQRREIRSNNIFCFFSLSNKHVAQKKGE